MISHECGKLRVVFYKLSSRINEFGPRQIDSNFKDPNTCSSFVCLMLDGFWGFHLPQRGQNNIPYHTASQNMTYKKKHLALDFLNCCNSHSNKHGL